MVTMNAAASSLPYDFLVKSTGKTDFYGESFGALPIPGAEPLAELLRNRALRLNCLTAHYANLWQTVASKQIAEDGFAKRDSRLSSWGALSPKWSRESALRTSYERRQALVEIDALVALSLGLTIEQLLLIYRVAFRILRGYERETYYDLRGKVVFTTNSKGLNGVGLDRKHWEEIKGAPAGEKLPKWASDAGGPFVPPFDACDRETDMAQAYRYFAEKLGISMEKS